MGILRSSKLAAGLAAGSLLHVGCASGYRNNITATPENYLEILVYELSEHEKNLGINNFGIPRIEFIVDENMDSSFNAAYNPSKDVMYFLSKFPSPSPIMHQSRTINHNTFSSSLQENQDVF